MPEAKLSFNEVLMFEYFDREYGALFDPAFAQTREPVCTYNKKNYILKKI